MKNESNPPSCHQPVKCRRLGCVVVILSLLLISNPTISVEPHTWLPIRQVESNHTSLRSIDLYACSPAYRPQETYAAIGTVEIDFGLTSSCPKPLKTYADAYRASLDGKKSKVLIIEFDGIPTEAHSWSFQIEYSNGLHLYDVVYPKEGTAIVKSFAKDDELRQQRHAGYRQNSMGIMEVLLEEFWGGHSINVASVDDPPPWIFPPYGKPKYLKARCRKRQGICPSFTVTLASLSDEAAPQSENAPCRTIGYALIPNALPTRGMPTATNYFVASRSRSSNEVTLCTQLTTDRMYKLRHLASNWEGSISASIFVRDHALDVPYITKFWLSYPELNSRVDVHLVFDDGRPPFKIPKQLPEGNSRLVYPINYMRNIAILNARTKYILLLEGDMTMPPGAFARMQRHISMGHFDYPDETKPIGFILPLFYPTRNFQKSDPIPKSKEEIYISRMFEYCPYSSHSFLIEQLDKWRASDENARPTEITISADDPPIEPYFVAKRESLPMFDENYYCREDKVQQVNECRHCVGFRYKLLPDLFLLNIDTFDAEETRDDRIGPRPQLCTWYLTQSHHESEALDQSTLHRQWAFGEFAMDAASGMHEEDTGRYKPPFLDSKTIQAGGALSCPPPDPCQPSLSPLLFVWNIILIFIIIYLWNKDKRREKMMKISVKRRKNSKF